MARLSRTSLIPALTILITLSLLFFLYSFVIVFFEEHVYTTDPVPFGEIIHDCPAGLRQVAVTFDDGPSRNTETVLAQLAVYGTTATFFLNRPPHQSPATNTAEADWMRKIHAAGHQLGSHTWNHVNLSSLSPHDIEWEVQVVERWIESIVGVRPRYLRPPYGDCDQICLQTLRKSGYHVVGWDLDTKDWKQADGSVEESMQTIREYEEIYRKWDIGPIVLMHDWVESTPSTLLPRALEYFDRLGYRFVSVAECLGGSEFTWYHRKDGRH